MELTTERLHLRPFTRGDEVAIHAVYADPEVMRFVGHGAHRTSAETAGALRTYRDVLERHGYSFLAVIERSSGALVAGTRPSSGARWSSTRSRCCACRASWRRSSRPTRRRGTCWPSWV
jgi:RimJ/RimL family protein N-acetyltransferase